MVVARDTPSGPGTVKTQKKFLIFLTVLKKIDVGIFQKLHIDSLLPRTYF
jgi:hypothetical protein